MELIIMENVVIESEVLFYLPGCTNGPVWVYLYTTGGNLTLWIPGVLIPERWHDEGNM